MGSAGRHSLDVDMKILQRHMLIGKGEKNLLGLSQHRNEAKVVCQMISRNVDQVQWSTSVSNCEDPSGWRDKNRSDVYDST